MNLSADYTFKAPQQQVWDLLMNTDAVGACLPGCKGLKPLGEDRYEVDLAVAVAAIAGNFKGTVTLANQQPPGSYTLLVDGSGRQGFVKGQAVITLHAEGEQTRVHVDANADAGGMIARLGQRLLEGVGKMTIDKFYACLAGKVS